MTKSLAKEVAALGQTVLVLQGGGALGAYQVGVYEALHEAGIAPDWVIGTSIGAINAALIAGSKPGERDRQDVRVLVARRRTTISSPAGLPNWMATATRNWHVDHRRRPGLLQPQSAGVPQPAQPARAPTPPAIIRSTRCAGRSRSWSTSTSSTTAAPGSPSARRACAPPRCAISTRRDMPLTLDHVLASGALPPAFPPVRIDGELYWDGGILSNTPVEVVFDDNPRRNSLVFAVHIWNPHGPEPETIWEVMNRQKDVQYSSRAVAHIKRQRQIHRMRHIIAELSKMVPEDRRGDNLFADLASYGCLTRMHVVRLLAPALDYEDHSKDIDFSAERHPPPPRGRLSRHDARRSNKAPWRDPVDEIEGFILHEASGGRMVKTASRDVMHPAHACGASKP